MKKDFKIKKKNLIINSENIMKLSIKNILLVTFLSLFAVSCTTTNLFVEEGDTVSVHYKWTFEDGEQFDSSYDRWTPLEFTAWAWEMIAWFDAAVIWMTTWEKKSITLSPDEAYGQRDENNKQVINKSDLSGFEEAGYVLEAGTVLPTQMWNFEILEADEETITIDGNHPMAGKTLNFDIEIVNITKN